MTQKEIAIKYGVPLCDVSVAIIANECIKPLGKREVVTSSGKTISVNEYSEFDVIYAIIALYISRSSKHIEKANAWTEKAGKLIEKRKSERRKSEL